MRRWSSHRELPIGALSVLPGLRAKTSKLIDAHLGPVPSPVRAVLFGVDRFRLHGFSLARAQKIERRLSWRRRAHAPHFFPRIAANLQSLGRSIRYIEMLDREGEALSPAAEWLLDNFHLIEAQVPEIRNGLPRGYYSALPKLRQQPLSGLPRVYGIAWAFVAHTDSNFDAKLLAQFLDAYQQVDVLTLGELWAIPTTLRVVLLENMDRLAEAVAGNKAAQEAADWCCDHEPPLRIDQLRAMHARVEKRALQTSFIAQILLRTRSRAAAANPQWLEWLNEIAPDQDAALAAAHEVQAADNVSVSNAVSALHMINALDWRNLIAELSPVLQALQQSAEFNADSDLTRDSCTHAIERLARRLRRPEIDLTRKLMGLEAGAGPAHFLIGPGRGELVEALGGTLTTLENPALQWPLRAPGFLYAGALAGGTTLLLSTLLRQQRLDSWSVIMALPLLALVSFECVMAIVNRSLAESIRVHRLPRLALEGGLRSQDRTLLVIPCIFASTDTVHELTQRLEQHYLANIEPHARFALLSDWADAPACRVDGDEAILTAACKAIEALNQRHPVAPGLAARFALLHRERSWNSSEQKWMGWERKRGKLEQLLAALVAISGKSGNSSPATDSPFINLGALSQIEQDTRYLITLDSDTGLPPGTLRELVSIAAHPLNQPSIDKTTRRVVAGFGILQPRIVSPLPPRETVTLFGSLFSGPWGMDVYNAGSSEIYQDVFGHGSFSGKGLIHVQAMHDALQGRVPENRLLSHDLYEGLWARAAHLSDVTLIETAPMHPDVAAARTHRWTRGDWQLLSMLAKAWQGHVGALNLWKIVDNLRRSLLAPASLVLLWLSFAADAVEPLTALVLVAGAFGLGPLMGSLAALLPGRRDLARRHFFSEGGKDLLLAAGGMVWQLITLPFAAATQIDAIARTIWRLLVSQQHLLQWTTAAQSQAAARSNWGWIWRKHIGISLLAVAWLATGFLLPDADKPWLLGLAAIWTLTPVWLWLAGQPCASRQQGLSREDQDYLRQLALDTWSLFEATVTPADHHLPPDNLQIEPEPILARRTSPTNIGLYLASCLCAQRLGFITSGELALRLQATLDTLEKLPRIHGHFYNWIDTATMATLTPSYVSTVDSGNLAALLWMSAQACQEIADEGLLEQNAGNDSSLVLTLRALAVRMEAITASMDFGFLYDRRRRLFRIGFRPPDASLDPSYYDLLASESRLGSYIAIAKGDVPVNHWQALGRPFLSVEGEPTLRSWSGSMFEYLMPSLLMREPSGGLLQRVSKAAVLAQRLFGARHKLPWGVSECAYFEQDSSLAFQYGPFGVPQLAMRRTPQDDLVIAPYATVLALLVDAPEAVANLHQLEKLGARGRHGFIEAFDFSPARCSAGVKMQKVSTYMAHHQGMSLLSLCNLLCGDAPRNWFERSPRAQAFGILMHERMPRVVVFQTRTIPRPPHRPDETPLNSGARLLHPAKLAIEGLPTLLLGNGDYSTCLRPNGAGQSRWHGQAINRARDDLLRDDYGIWQFLRCADQAQFHSLTQAPNPAPQTEYLTRFQADHAEFVAVNKAWESQIEVWISPDDDVELRRLTLHNLADEAVEFELISFFEAALAPQAAEESHPVFQNLFIRAYMASPGCLLLERKARLAGEHSLWVAHFLAYSDVLPGAELLSLQVESDRSQMLPRRGDYSQMHALPLHATQAVDPDPAPAQLDTGLDPVGALKLRLCLPSRAKRSMTFACAAASDKETLLAIVDAYRQEVHLTRSKLMSLTLARIRQRELRLSGLDLQYMQDLATPMTVSCTRQQETPETMLDRRTLWRFAISGERPILLVRISSSLGLRALRTLLTAHRMWDLVGLRCDLMVVNGEPHSYLMPLQQHILALRNSVGSDQQQSDRGSVRLLQLSDVSPQELAALCANARIDLVLDGSPLNQLLLKALRSGTVTDAVEAGRSSTTHAPSHRSAAGAAWPADSAPGRFSQAGGSFEIDINALQLPPRPWANVMANSHFGCIVTESGGGYTWANNSRLNQLTPWSNDPLLDPAGEHFLVQDRSNGAVFGLLPEWDRNGEAGYQVVHRPGSSSFSQDRDGLAIETTVMVHPQEAVKWLRLRINCTGSKPHRLRLVGMVEWQLGAQRRDRMTLQTSFEPAAQAVMARQIEHSGGFGNGTAYLMLVGQPVTQWSCARKEFFDQEGTLQLPDRLGSAQGFGLDPCGAIATDLDLLPGESYSFSWVIGYAPDQMQALAQARRVSAPGFLKEQASQVNSEWEQLLSAIRVTTPDPLFDALVNHWLIYQTLSCRIWAKAGFYQASGASGFRDQLQDAMALAYARPDLLRKQLLLHASRQFAEGDVQHWWHMPSGAGVRTRFSDDLLWLPYAIQQYLQVSGDRALLEQSVTFIEGPTIPAGAEDIYCIPAIDSSHASMYEHAARAIDRSLRFGDHGLPLMGCGDWNDGMNRVGHEGRGESVWLAWFLLVILRDWLPMARERGEDSRALRWEAARQSLGKAVDLHGWDGAWYRRAYFDNGHPLGSKSNDECRIDLIAQVWSVFASPPGDARAAQAMQSADALLVDRKTGLIRLLDPPLQHAADNAGYIQAYPAGVRENGGQYSHAGVWAVMAQAQLGNASLAWEYFCMLSPAHRSAEAGRRQVYAIEPYVMPGDIYSAPPYQGRGGWSWYTGSAAWLYRAAIESLLGLQIQAREFCLRPCLPPAWPQAQLHLRLRGKQITLLLRRSGLSTSAPLPPGTLGIAIGQWVEFDRLPERSTLLLELSADQ